MDATFPSVGYFLGGPMHGAVQMIPHPADIYQVALPSKLSTDTDMYNFTHTKVVYHRNTFSLYHAALHLAAHYLIYTHGYPVQPYVAENTFAMAKLYAELKATFPEIALTKDGFSGNPYRIYGVEKAYYSTLATPVQPTFNYQKKAEAEFIDFTPDPALWGNDAGLL